jgi:hypothetical protein
LKSQKLEPKKMGILTKPMRKYVLSETKQGYNISEYDRRIVEYTSKGLEDLTLLAQELPEEQQAKIFNKETLQPLFKAIFRLEIPAKDHEEYLKIKSSEEIVKKRKRLLGLCDSALNLIGDYSFVGDIVPEPMRPFMSASWPPIDNIKALLYTSLKEEEYLKIES